MIFDHHPIHQLFDKGFPELNVSVLLVSLNGQFSVHLFSSERIQNTLKRLIFSFTPVIAGSNLREVGMADLAAKSSNLTISQSPPVWKI